MDPRLNQFFAVVKRSLNPKPMAMRVKVVGNSPILQTVIIRQAETDKFKLLPCEELQRDAMFLGIHEDGLIAYRDWGFKERPHRPDEATEGMIRHRTAPIIGLFTNVVDAYACVTLSTTDHRFWDKRWFSQTSDVLKKIRAAEIPLILSTKLLGLAGGEIAKPELLQNSEAMKPQLVQ